MAHPRGHGPLLPPHRRRHGRHGPRDVGLAAAEVPAANQTVMAFSQEPSVLEDARQALLSMGFSPQETELALDGYDGQGMRVEDLLGAALRRLGMDA